MMLTRKRFRPKPRWITSDAFVMISRNFAPPEQRLKSLTSRLKLMPNVLAQGRKNLDNPPRVYTEIAIDQIDGNRTLRERRSCGVRRREGHRVGRRLQEG
jgi:hypothetical protein